MINLNKGLVMILIGLILMAIASFTFTDHKDHNNIPFEDKVFESGYHRN